jgi:integrase
MAKRASGEGSIKKRKDGRWVGLVSFGYKANGKRDRRAVYGSTQQEAKEAIKKLLEQSQKLKSPQYLTLNDFFPEWYKTKLNVTEKTKEMYEYNSTRLLAVVGKIKVSELSIKDVEKMIQQVTETHSAHAASKCRQLLKQIMDKAVAWDYAIKNPVLYTEAPKLKSIEPSVWSFAEVAFFLDSLKHHRLYPAFYVMVSLGLRRGELLGLRWQDVTPSSISINQNWTIIRKKATMSTPKTKAGKRTIPIASDVYDLLCAHRLTQHNPKHSELVFLSEAGTPINPRNLDRDFHLYQRQCRTKYLISVYESGTEQEALEALSKVNSNQLFKPLRLHDLRHTHVSLRVNNSNISLSELAQQIGHARLSYTLDIYTHLLPNRDVARASLEALRITN